MFSCVASMHAKKLFIHASCVGAGIWETQKDCNILLKHYGFKQQMCKNSWWFVSRFATFPPIGKNCWNVSKYEECFRIRSITLSSQSSVNFGSSFMADLRIQTDRLASTNIYRTWFSGNWTYWSRWRMFCHQQRISLNINRCGTLVWEATHNSYTKFNIVLKCTEYSVRKVHVRMES